VLLLKSCNWNYDVSFGRPISFCTVHSQVDISLAAYYLWHWSAHKYLSKKPDHISNLHLQNDWLVVFSIWKTLISSNSDRKRCRTLTSLNQRNWEQYNIIVVTFDFIREDLELSVIYLIWPNKLNCTDGTSHILFKSQSSAS